MLNSVFLPLHNVGWGVEWDEGAKRGGDLQGEKHILDGCEEGTNGISKAGKGHEVLLSLVGKAA